MRRHSPCFESLEVRTVLDGSGLCAIEFDDSPFVSELDGGTLRFGSLNVETQQGSSQNLADNEFVVVRGHDLRVGQVKEFLHGFADSLGPDAFPETNDLRFLSWGTGSGSTSARFEAFMVEQVESQSPCQGLQFAGPVRFELPGEGGDFFTGGFLDLDTNGRGGLLLGGDIVQVVDSYEIEGTVSQTTLTVDGEFFGDVSFVVNDDYTLTDEFGQVWQPDSDEYQVIDPNAVDPDGVDPNATDELLGDLDGDGMVAFVDFLMLSRNFGEATAAGDTARGDLDGDGFVAFSDFLILASNFGNTLDADS